MSKYTVIKLRHIREVFIKENRYKYRYLKYSKDTCIQDCMVSYSYYLNIVESYKKITNTKVLDNYIEVCI